MTIEQAKQALSWLNDNLGHLGKFEVRDDRDELYSDPERLFLINCELDDCDFMFSPNGCYYGDYVGGMVGMSNVAVLEQDYPDISEVRYESYGYTKWMVNVKELFGNLDLMLTIQGLEDYPLIDEDRYSELCHSTQQDQWSEFGRDDLCRELTKKFPNVPRDLWDHCSFDLCEIMELTGYEPVDENCTWWFGDIIDRFVDGYNPEGIDDIWDSLKSVRYAIDCISFDITGETVERDLRDDVMRINRELDALSEKLKEVIGGGHT